MSATHIEGTTAAHERDVLIRNAYVLTMDPVLQDIPCGDVHISGGKIAAVGTRLSAPGARTIEASGKVVMPGLIDSHTHLWSSQLRGCFSGGRDGGYFKVRNVLADGYLPEDMYIGTQLGTMEAIAAGTTTLVDFSHNNRGREYSEASIRALRDSGLRCRYLLGASTRTSPRRTIDLGLLERLASNWPSLAEAPVSLGLAWRGPLGVTSLDAGAVATDVSVAREELTAARRLRLPMAVHVSGHASKAIFDSLRANEFLGPDVQLIHFTAASAEDIRHAAASGATLSLTPITELRTGYGTTATGHYLDHGIRTGLGVDSGALAGTSSMFDILKFTQLVESGRVGTELPLSARRLLELATIDGACSLGMSNEIGSLTPGKSADLIVVASDALSMVRAGSDPAQLLVEGTRPEQVETVIVAGRLLKDGGVLSRVESRQVLERAAKSLDSIASRAASARPSAVKTQADTAW